MVIEDTLVNEDRQGQPVVGVGEPRAQVVDDELIVGREEVVARRQVQLQLCRAANRRRRRRHYRCTTHVHRITFLQEKKSSSLGI